MASTSVPSTKDGLVDPYAPSSSSPSETPSGPFSVFRRLSKWRADLGLPYPGNVENMTKEVKATHMLGAFFDGARADLTKSMSMNPLFQVTHSFQLGSQVAPPSYNFGAVFGNENIFLQGNIDHDGNVNARINQGWSPRNVTKMQAQISATPGHSLLQAEQDYQGLDYNLNLKALNPWPSDLTGIYVGSYLQSLTKNLAVGTECMFQHPTPDISEFVASYIAKLTATDKSWIATANIQPMGVLQATYWHKLSEKVDFAADLSIMTAPSRRDAIATIGAKYDLRMSCFRAQLDSTGKVSALLEQRFTPTFSFTLSGEIDHFKNAAKVGFGVAIESTSLTQEEMEAQMPMAS
ncbi:eukaryotic porin-domain-containing protein [Mucidula mucida]|nr:eukaryotic porin-domain-containing protein [Mucidula mucida]